MSNIATPEMPVPEERFREQGIASRATFFRWQRQGLKVLKVGGRRFIRPSDLVAFMEQQAKQAK